MATFVYFNFVVPMTPPRFKRLNVVWEMPETWCEVDYVTGALEELERHFALHGLADRFIFVVTSHGDRLSFKHRDRVIVIQVSDEGHTVPSYVDDVFMVFKVFRPFTPMPDNLRIIPVGPNKDVPAPDPAIGLKPMRARGLDVFFNGQSDLRADFFMAALPLNDRTDINARISDSGMFRGGMPPAEFAKLLADTKIALCPRGISHESFRIYEAMRAGCIVIAARQMPTWFTTGWPVFELDDWTGLEPLVDGLLGDEGRLEEVSQRTLAWWHERCCPEAVGRYIADEIVGRLLRA
ncbi:MAG: hypothetical protein K0Q70_1817 [Rhodospirillales bacterium]|jgi:hypothetical protein|nr:hypothetical protein [Rhodospirillales bacterium]